MVWPEEWVIVSEEWVTIYVYEWRFIREEWVRNACRPSTQFTIYMNLIECLKSDRRVLSEEWVIMHINVKFLGVLTVWRIPGNLDKKRSANPGEWPEEWVTSGKYISRRSICVHIKLLFNPLYMKNFWEFWQFGGISRICFVSSYLKSGLKSE